MIDLRSRHYGGPVLAVLLGLCLLAAPGVRAQEVMRLAPDQALTQYHLDGWTTDDGLPQNSVNAIVQTRDGYLWLGTQEGLARFDGLRFQIFDKSNSGLLANTVEALYEDRKGRLWIGTRGGGLTMLENGHMTAFTPQESGAPGEVGALTEAFGGDLWVASYTNGLGRFNGTKFEPFTTENGLPSDNINALISARDGSLWVGTRDAGLVHLSEGAVSNFTTTQGLPADDVTVLQEDKDGTLWIGTRGGGLTTYHQGRFTTFTTDDGLPGNVVLSLFRDALGNLWVGTDRGGLARYREGAFETISTDDGLVSDVVSSLYEDREGSLWIGTHGGLHRLRAGKFDTYTTAEGLVHDFAYAIYEDDEGAVWIGTDGGVSRFQHGRFTAYTADDGLAGNVVISLYGTRDGSLWMGTYGDGLSRLRDGQFTTYTTADGLADDIIWALFEDSRSTLWIATKNGLGALRNGRFELLTEADGLSSNIITALAEDGRGNLWIGTYNGGLNVRRPDGSIENITMENGLQSNFVLSIHVDDDDTVWFSTREGGLNRLRAGRLTVFTTKDGLYNDTIQNILEDARGNLWMSCNKGLFRLHKNDLHAYAAGRRATLNAVAYTQSDGLKSPEFNGGTQPAGWRGRDGQLWFPTSKGVVAFHPEELPYNALPPLVVIEEVRANEHDVAIAEKIALAPGHDKVEFHYAGLSFLAPEKVRYRYMLEGVDETWVEAAGRREAFYTNLAPGTYTFKVVARNADGVWSPTPATTSLYLEPYFYQTWAFYGLCVLALVLLGLGSLRFRVRQLKARQKDLERTVMARTKDLREEKEKTEEALREARRQREIAEKARSVIEEQADQLREMDRIKTRFFNNISHEFRTPLTLNIGPLENALTGVYGSVNDELRVHLEIMLRNSRRLLRLINQLLDLAKLESGRMEPKMRHGNLVQLLEGIVLSFTPFALQSNIALNFQTDAERAPTTFDPECMEKVFFNLLSNAVKFTPEGGHVEVSLVPAVAALEGAQKAFEIRVRDTGPGIPADQIPYIFDRFHQVDGTVSKMQEGTGIGLSLVKELVELHDGTIAVESEVGVGTTFVVTLPRNLAADADNEAPQNEDTYISDLLDSISQGPMVEMAVFDEAIDRNGQATNGALVIGTTGPLLLVVDDNPDIRGYVVSCLKEGFRVATARDGEEGLEKARQLRPDLVLSDVMMPKMDGHALCRALKADPDLTHIPVILLTAKASITDKVEGLEAGADDYLAKPFNAKELLARIKNLLELHQKRNALIALNSELEETNETLRETSEMKSQLLRIAAHDLKNPLNAIREFSKLIKEEITSEAPHVHEFLGLIESASNQMLQMIRQFLDSEVLENGAPPMEMASIRLSALAEAVVARNRAQAERKSQQLTLTVRTEDDTVEGDQEWLLSALDNLISNAIKYSPPQKTVEVIVRAEGGQVRFEVHDEGPGLTPEDRDRLFGKFQRLSARPTGGESSTGLGLSIVKQIAELHAGQILVESEPGQGSNFILSLPATRPTSSTVSA